MDSPPAGACPGFVIIPDWPRVQDYLFTATDPDGRTVHDRIAAANLNQARYMLEIRKYTDIEFLTDENGADIRRAVRLGTGVATAAPGTWTPADEVASRRRRGIAAKLLWAAKGHAAIFAVFLDLAYWASRSPRPYGWGAWAAFIALPLYCLWFVRCVLPMITFQLILESSVWHEWWRLRRLIGFARLMRRFFRTGIPDMEIDIREATSWAAQGQLERGLALVEKYRGLPGVAEYLYLGRLSAVYEAAGDFDRVVSLREEAAAKGPGGVTQWIDLALVRIRRKHDVAGARAALAHIQDKEVTALAYGFQLLVEGMILSEEKNDLQAVEYFSSGIEKLEHTGGTPIVKGLIGETRARMAFSLARLGRREAAAKLLKTVRPLLEARRETALLSQCDAAIGNSIGGAA